MSVARRIVDLARWAPSGDNTQPWRFEIRSERELLVHGYDTRRDCVYDLDGWASQLAHGALLETLAMAATRFGHRADVVEIAEASAEHVVYRIALSADGSVTEHPLVASIQQRTVQRRPMSSAKLDGKQKASLEAAARPFSVVWFESPAERRAFASLNYTNAHIRMTIPEAFDVHRRVIAFDARTSVDRLPAESLGMGSSMLAMTRWAMASWSRMERVNRLMGTTLPRLVLDFIPGVRCAAHFALIAPDARQDLRARIDAGRAVQRCWLAATAQGLQQQPSYTPLVFARYAREGRRFSRVDHAHAEAARVATELARLLRDVDPAGVVWLGRLGQARKTDARSLRLPLDDLIVADAPDRLGLEKTSVSAER